MMQKQVKGTCIVRNHPQYGTIFININKFNKQYIRVIKDETTNIILYLKSMLIMNLN